LNAGNRLKLRVDSTEMNAFAEAQSLESKEPDRVVRIDCRIQRGAHTGDRGLLRKRRFDFHCRIDLNVNRNEIVDPPSNVRIATLVEKAAELERECWLLGQWFLIVSGDDQLNVRMGQRLQRRRVARHPRRTRLRHAWITQG